MTTASEELQKQIAAAAAAAGVGQRPLTDTSQLGVRPYGGLEDGDDDGGGTGGGGGGGYEYNRAQGIANLGSVAGYNRDTILGAANQTNQAFDVAEQQNANLRKLQTTQNRRNSGNEWYTQQQRLQSTVGQLMDATGNAMNGSSLYDLMDMIARKDDMDDVAVLNNMRQNQNTIDNNYWESMMASLNNRNENTIETESNLREIASDWAAQANNIDADLAAEYFNNEGHTLNVPDWLDTSYFSNNFRQALTPDEQGLYRPPSAAATANEKGLIGDRNNIAQAANQDYRTRMLQGYNRRSQ